MAKNILLDNTILTKDRPKTYLTADITSGTILTVQGVNGFSGSINILIGDIGQEEAEIFNIHSTAQASGTAIYLNTGVGKSHSVDTPVYAIDWDKFEVSHAATASGTKTTLTATAGTALKPDSKETLYKDTTKTSGFYFVRFMDTCGSGYSDYSDPIPYAGYPNNTVWSIKDRALKKVDAKIDEKITNDFLNECLWEARREYHKAPGKRPFRRLFNQDLGNVATGDYRIPAPNDLEEPYSAENVFGIRIGKNDIVHFYDKKDFDDDYKDVAHSVLLYDIGATSVSSFSALNGRDFDASGIVQIENDKITYTARNITSGSFTVALTGTTHTANADIWQGVTFGLPNNFTVFRNPGESAYIYFNCPFDTTYVDLNIWGDYYRTLVPYDSDADELDEPNYDFYVDYLAAMIKKRLNPNLELYKDSDYLEYQRKKQLALSTEYLGSEIRFVI